MENFEDTAQSGAVQAAPSAPTPAAIVSRLQDAHAQALAIHITPDWPGLIVGLIKFSETIVRDVERLAEDVAQVRSGVGTAAGITGLFQDTMRTVADLQAAVHLLQQRGAATDTPSA